ncbi:ubiquitin-conjugating enzyme/RWD-like protein [Flammula alnicola]|nr:ubiquitin-conjugating enzyme/RWD-like protein [Flammula alnicola]
MTALNKNNSAIKRIMQEARELANDPCTDYSAAPLEDDIFEWHCTLRGPAGTEFEGGLYHFRILLPAEYPFRPPSIMILTPNGRFELNTKICISFTSYHEELWQPAWGVRTAIIGLQGFFPLKGQAAVGVGSIEYPTTERKRLAALSREWTCPHCQQTNLELLPDPPVQQSGRVLGSKPKSLVPSESEPPSKESDATLASANGIIHADNLPTAAQPKPLDTQNSEPDLKAAAVASQDRSGPESLATGNLATIRLYTPPSGDSVGANSSPSVPSSASTSPVGIATSTTPSSTPTIQAVRGPTRSSQKPPVLLDTAICILLVLLFAIICRRMV